MKKNLLLIAVLLLSMATGFSQATFNTGAMQVEIDEYGAIELFSADGLYQLDRASLLVGTSATTVFDYKNDAESLDPTTLVATPSMSDFEIYGSFDNTYSSLPPAVIVKLNAYGWTNEGYVILRFNIQNNEAAAINATAGLDIIPYIHEEWGYDTVSYNSVDKVIRFHRGTGVNMGMQLLSADLTSLYSFEWYSDYSVDTDYWTWMNKASLQPEYISTTGDGPVTITAQDLVTLDPGESFNVFYVMALGNTEAEMLANISESHVKYQLLTTGVSEKPMVSSFGNYPNPAKSSTTISYQLPAAGEVTIKLYDALGQLKGTLVSEKQNSGLQTYELNTDNLAAGVYTYSLIFNNEVVSNKMLIVK